MMTVAAAGVVGKEEAAAEEKCRRECDQPEWEEKAT
jgi:hypothetical protein